MYRTKQAERSESTAPDVSGQAEAPDERGEGVDAIATPPSLSPARQGNG